MASILEPQVPSPSTSTTTLIPPRAKPLSKFQRLAPDVYLYTPPSPTTSPGPNEPTTILLCSWMNAAAKHIDYYTRTYMSLYPNTRIIIVRINTKQFLFESEAQRRSEISTAVSALLAAQSSDPAETQRLVIHAISNGGAKRAYGVAGLYLSQTGKPIPARGFICDSAPGIPQFKRDMHALMFPFRNMNLLAWLPVYGMHVLVVSFVFVCIHWMPKTFWGELVWMPTKYCNEPGFIPTQAMRGYVYSKEDMSIDWRDVEAHAEDARGKGYEVVTKLVEDAHHAQLWNGKGGEGDYWSWVKEVWEMGFGLR